MFLVASCGDPIATRPMPAYLAEGVVEVEVHEGVQGILASALVGHLIAHDCLACTCENLHSMQRGTVHVHEYKAIVMVHSLDSFLLFFDHRLLHACIPMQQDHQQGGKDCAAV